MKKYENLLAADCVLKACYEIVKDSEDFEEIWLGIMINHGHRNNQDHLVKIISWAAKVKGRWTVKFYCLDVDIGGHTTEEAAEAVRLSVDNFIETIKEFAPGKEVLLDCITGDSGGGAAVQKLLRFLIRIGVMNSSGRKLPCDMHGWNKPLEVACVDVFGKQGIGANTPFQIFL